MDDEQALRDLYEDMYRGMVTKDRERLERVLAPEFVLVHMTGMHQSREEYLQAIANGTLNYYSASTEGFDVRVLGNEATVVGRSRVSAAVFGGGRRTWPLQQRLTCRKAANGWRITRSVASTY